MTPSRLIPYSSLYRFISVIKNNGGLHYSRIQRLSPYLTRIVLFEPISWLETIVMERKIQKHELKQAPIFVLGHWRSGTTFLQRLLSEDDRFGYHNLYKAIFPQMYVSTEKVLRPLMQYGNNVIGAKNPFHRVKLEWISADEDDTGFLGLISPHTSYWGQVMPSSYKKLMLRYSFVDENSQKKYLDKWKSDYMYMIKKLSLHYQKPLILRTPPNTGRIKQLLELFPDAKFIYIHRNPYDVYNSNLGLWKANLKNFCFQKPSQQEVEDNILFGYKLLLSNYIKQRELIPENNLVEIRYEDLFNDTMGKMEHIYKHLSLPNFNEVKPKLEGFVNAKKSKEKTSYNYSSEMIEKVNQHWGFSLDEWKYEDSFLETV